MASELSKEIFHRSELLLGAEVMERLRNTRVIIFGVGGVGSWCAEALVRNGITHLTIVDSDDVAASNVNRQLMATTKTIGRMKVDALRERLLEINPEAEITALQTIYNAENASDFHLEEYDYVIDAIDSLKDKISLIINATSHENVTFFSSMGAACRIDPTKIKVCEFWKVRDDTLGAILRKRIRQKKLQPGKKFLCVCSSELPRDNRGFYEDSELTMGSFKKAQVNGSLVHITAIYGMTLAGLVMKDIDAEVSGYQDTTLE